MPYKKGHQMSRFMGRNRELYLASRKRYYQKQKAKHLHDGWVRRLRRQFGLTESEYHAMLSAQNGVCAICLQVERKQHKGKPQRLSVDHCHESGRVRGLLCHSCNAAIGHFRDDPLTMYRAAKYVRDAK